ncbi:hypothetical protein ENBRE01_0810 [Enteropsectra breve]|nr:hypothetical protein ENBRE01_0810 [Enteropsectra breve]
MFCSRWLKNKVKKVLRKIYSKKVVSDIQRAVEKYYEIECEANFEYIINSDNQKRKEKLDGDIDNLLDNCALPSFAESIVVEKGFYDLLLLDRILKMRKKLITNTKKDEISESEDSSKEKIDYKKGNSETNVIDLQLGDYNTLLDAIRLYEKLNFNQRAEILTEHQGKHLLIHCNDLFELNLIYLLTMLGFYKNNIEVLNQKPEQTSKDNGTVKEQGERDFIVFIVETPVWLFIIHKYEIEIANGTINKIFFRNIRFSADEPNTAEITRKTEGSRINALDVIGSTETSFDKLRWVYPWATRKDLLYKEIRFVKRYFGSVRKTEIIKPATDSHANDFAQAKELLEGALEPYARERLKSIENENSL